MKKFKYFGVVIHSAGDENYDWVNMSKDEIPVILRELSFSTPKEVGITMSNLLVRGDKKPKRSWSIKTDPEYYYGKVEQIFGHLELDAKGETYNDGESNLPILEKKANFYLFGIYYNNYY